MGSDLRRVEHHMGTAVSLALHDADDGVADCFYAQVASYERMFSRFLPDSEISRLSRGDIDLDAASPDVREVLTACEDLRDRTGGWFDHEPSPTGDVDQAPADRVLDPNALAKGWIIQRSALSLRMAGVDSFFVNAGGDVLIGAAPRGRSGWRVGIRHPVRPGAVVAVLDLERTAIATSGTYERGGHIRSPEQGRSPGDGLTSVTVVGPDLGVADALATAVYAADDSRPTWWDRRDGYQLLSVTGGGSMRWTEGLSPVGR